MFKQPDNTNTEPHFLPALRFEWLTRYYDRLIATFMPERRFRMMLVEQAQLRTGMRVLDVGCGTGSLAILIKRLYPEVEVVGVDPDAKALAIAKRKIAKEGLRITFEQGSAEDLPFEPHSFDRVFSSLVFHHLERGQKLRAFQSIRNVLTPTGELHVADWGKAQNMALRSAFLLVQLLDGFKTTTDNVRGKLPEQMQAGGFETAGELTRIPTILGTLSLYKATL